MGKTFRRNDYHRPKNKDGNKSRKQKEFDDDFRKHRMHHSSMTDDEKIDVDELLKDLGEE